MRMDLAKTDYEYMKRIELAQDRVLYQNFVIVEIPAGDVTLSLSCAG
jgi:hypothetical protein